MVSSEAVPIECYTREKRTVIGLGPMVSSFDLAKVNLDLKGWKAELEVLVALSGYIRNTALLGRDVPGLHVTVQPLQEILLMQTQAQRRDTDCQDTWDQLDSEQSGANPELAEDLLDLEETKETNSLVGSEQSNGDQ